MGSPVLFGDFLNFCMYVGLVSKFGMVLGLPITDSLQISLGETIYE